MLPLLALTAAAAPRGEVGVGLVGEIVELENASVEVVGRIAASEHLSIELAGRTPIAYQPVTDLDRVILGISYEAYGSMSFRKPISAERAALTLLADWGFEPRPTGPGLTGGLHLLGGPEARLALDYVGRVSAAYDRGEPDAEVVTLSDPMARIVVGAAIGFGFYAHAGERVSLRVTLLDHLAFEPERAWDEDGTPGRLRLTSGVTTSTGVLVAF